MSRFQSQFCSLSLGVPSVVRFLELELEESFSGSPVAYIVIILINFFTLLFYTTPKTSLPH